MRPLEVSRDELLAFVPDLDGPSDSLTGWLRRVIAETTTIQAVATEVLVTRPRDASFVHFGAAGVFRN